MANGKITLGKQSGGTLGLVFPDGVTNTEVVLPDSGTLAKTSDIQGFKNYIINGGFDIWQRGTSQTTTGYGSADRWALDTRQGLSYTINQGETSISYPTVSAGKYFANCSFSPTIYANDSVERGMFLDQWIEDGFAKLKGKTITISILADTAQDFVIALGSVDSTSSQGGTAPTWRKLASKKFTHQSGVYKYTATFTLPSNIIGNDTYKDHLLLWFSFGCNQYYSDAGFGVGNIPAFNTTGTFFNLFQVQLEEGSVATPFENRPYGLELSLCQRYARPIPNSFEIAFTGDYTYGGFRCTFSQMRTAPTVTSMGAFTAYGGSDGTPLVTVDSNESLGIRNSSNNWTPGNGISHYGGFLSAEL